MKAPKRSLFIVAILILASITAVAQDAKREAQLRTVHGIVEDKSENLVSESVVFRNTRTNVVRSSYNRGSFGMHSPLLMLNGNCPYQF